jgi:8-oxo-dGTP pyrophosphatase MutT (NUDIX family)
MAGRKAHSTARREALEEAGVIGRISKRPFGSFRYRKRLIGEIITCEVRVFPLRVERQRHKWREKSERKTRWLPLEQALKAIDEPELRMLIERFSAFG